MNNDFEKRLLKERDELGEKVEKLNAFINQNPAFNNVSERQKELLLLQLAIMTQYLSTLNERILDLGIVEMEEERKELTYGQKYVGINFNPSNDDKVAMAKKLCADLTDLLINEISDTTVSLMKKRMIDHTLGEILNAQMNVVKVLTFNY